MPAQIGRDHEAGIAVRRRIPRIVLRGVAKSRVREAPEEDWGEGGEGKCGRLNVSMYGTRYAALNWAEEYAQKLVKAGFRRGISNPCLFWHGNKKVTIMVHGDEFLAVG